MSDGYLSFEHGNVRLGGKLVPGTLISMEISDAVRFDSAQVDNVSGTKKTPLGWEDSVVTLEILLGTDEDSNCYEKLTLLDNVFKGMDNKSNPKVYTLTNAHATARGVDQVVFAGLKSRETNEDDTIVVALGFDEHNPPTIPPEVRSSADGTVISDAAPQAAAEASVDSVVTADPDSSAFTRGFEAGIS